MDWDVSVPRLLLSLPFMLVGMAAMQGFGPTDAWPLGIQMGVGMAGLVAGAGLATTSVKRAPDDRF